MSQRFIDREEIKRILTQDSHYRKNQRWPLLTSENFNLITSHKKIDVINMLNVKLEHKENEIHFTINDFSERIDKKYKFVNKILNKFKGHLVACGGSIINTLIDIPVVDRQNTKTKHSDLDLFFYDLNIEEANKMRISVISEIITIWKSYFDHIKFIIKRNEFVTSVYVFDDDKVIVEYQLIHRIYPDISSIIGGFDIGACMLAYDGDEIYATPLGAWSLRNRSIIVDTKRRSTSYEHRLVKYFDRGFRIIFPGLNNEHLNNYKNILGSASESEEILKFQILSLVKECGYKIDNIKNIMSECSKIQNIADNNISLQNLVLSNHYNRTYLGLTKYNNKFLSQKSLNKISDYHNDSDMEFNQFILSNITKLRLSNLKAVSSMIIIDNYQENIYDILLTDVDNPNLQLNKNSIRSYKRKIKYVKSLLINHYNDFNVDFYRAMKYFGNFANEVLNIKNISEYDYYRDIMIKIMIDNDKICKERLKGINWITQNPGRQWTSSINPIVSDPREWYGENYIPVITGIPIDIESTLRLFCLPRTVSFWSYLPTEIFNLILFYLSKNYADEAWQYIMI